MIKYRFLWKMSAIGPLERKLQRTRIYILSHYVPLIIFFWGYFPFFIIWEIAQFMINFFCNKGMESFMFLILMYQKTRTSKTITHYDTQNNFCYFSVRVIITRRVANFFFPLSPKNFWIFLKNFCNKLYRKLPRVQRENNLRFGWRMI